VKRGLAQPRQAGISLIETLAVITILVTLYTILQPVLFSAMRQTIISRSLANMRTIHSAHMLYANDYLDAQSTYGVTVPLDPVGFSRTYKLSKEVLRTGGIPRDGMSYAVYTWMYLGHRNPLMRGNHQGEGPWERHVIATSGVPILIVDPTQDPNQTMLFTPKRAYGIYYSGQLSRRISRGVLTSYQVWEE
jgi:type II secretory pathway pseudopilin PulG